MKTVKRVLAVVFLVLLIWAIGYLVYTGSRLFSNNSNTEEYKGATYKTDNGNYYLEITDAYDARLYNQGVAKYLVFKSLEDGILTFLDGEQEYVMAIIPDGIYDLQTDQIMWRYSV